MSLNDMAAAERDYRYGGGQDVQKKTGNTADWGSDESIGPPPASALRTHAERMRSDVIVGSSSPSQVLGVGAGGVGTNLPQGRPLKVRKDTPPIQPTSVKVSIFVDFSSKEFPHSPSDTFTVEVDGKTYVGCRTEWLDEHTTRLWIEGAPETPAVFHLSNAEGRVVPRRNCIDLMTPAEQAIYDAMLAVEKAGADVRLTDATNRLQAARDAVADHVDGVPRRHFVKTRPL